MCSLHCHKVIKLSDAVQHLPREMTCFVHGVGEPFLEVGRAQKSKSAGLYFIGKAVGHLKETNPILEYMCGICVEIWGLTVRYYFLIRSLNVR
jgi:hypothetical protein